MSRIDTIRLTVVLVAVAVLALATPAMAAVSPPPHASSAGALALLWQWLIGPGDGPPAATSTVSDPVNRHISGDVGYAMDPDGAKALGLPRHGRAPRAVPTGAPYRSLSASEGGAADPDGQH